MTTPSFENAVCKVCKTEAICHFGVGGSIRMLPFGWELLEDKTTDRKGPMASVCGERCKTKLKELNRNGRAQRMGF